MCDSFHGNGGKNGNSHKTCPQSFKPEYWDDYLYEVGIRDKEWNTSSAEQNNAKLRNLETTVRYMKPDNYRMLVITFCAMYNASRRNLI